MTKHPAKPNLVASFYWRRVMRYPRYVIALGISLPITVLVNGYLPALILADVLSRLASHDYQSNRLWDSFGTSLVGYAILVLGGILLWRVVDHFMWRLEANIQRDLAEEVFDHMLDETADFHANNFTGSLVSQTNKLLGSYVRIADTTAFQVYPMIAGVIIVVIILLPRAPLFVLSLLIYVLIFLLIAFKISKPVRRVGTKYASTESKQTGLLADAITNAMAVKSFARGQYERARFRKATNTTHSALMDVARLHQIQMNGLGMLTRTISASSLATAVISVMFFRANVATVFLILSYTASIVEQLFAFGNNSLRNYNRAIGDATDMVVILGQTPAVQDPENPEPSRIERGIIEFDEVTFVHNGATKPIFDKLSIKIKEGEKIGLVGHSGSGKTSFTRLLLRFSDVQSGEIRIDGQNTRAITQDDLHAKLAYVPQEPLLFHRSIAENIGYGSPSADQADIERVAKHAHAHEFVSQLPSGYETLVGERGVKLSGGQRQRVAIARAMLKDAPILVLDEATSALDSESEVLIQDALWKLMEGRTTIVIAHRLSTIQHMDRIIVLDNGKIVEEGSHKTLLNKKGVYAKLWAHQSGGFIEE